MHKKQLNLLLLPLVSLLTIISANKVWAGGFALNEQSVKNLGNAFAGSSAAAEDATTIFFNPAGLTRLEDNSIVGAGFLILPNINFENQGSTVVTGAPLTGGNGGNAGVDTFVPSFFAAWNVSDNVKAGIGVNVPFGLSTKYNRDWVGRYYAVESKVATYNINPTVAAKLTNNLSVGAGLNVQYADVKLTNAIDLGLIGRRAGLPTQPQQADGFVEVSGSDWSVGYNLGVMYEPTKNTRIGLSYRSPITQNIRGNADFTVPDSARAITARGQFTDTGASAVLNLPDTLSLGVYHQLNPRLAVMGDLTWTQWSRFKEIRVKFDNPAQPDRVQPENWNDTYRLGVGVNYAVNDKLTLRSGLTYDPSPVPEEFNSPRLPGGDRTILGLGASYQTSDSLSVDIGYIHIFSDDSPIDESSPTDGTVKGNFSSDVDVIGVQVNWQF
ncbi:MAG TPA: outer membrane protein transport protein [Nostocaceae cyanobacterium]|nr:outer membrane protein transport protein [Nostocaceae cyanobacterium]